MDAITYGIRDIVPSYATIDEGALLLIEESNKTFNGILQSVGIAELQSFEESGDVVVYEAGGEKIKTIINKIVEWLKKTFEEFKGWLDKQLSKMQTKVNEFKDKVKDKRTDRLSKMAARLVDKDKEGKVKTFGKTYEYKNLEAMMNVNGTVWKDIIGYTLIVRSDFNKAKDMRSEINADELASAFDDQKKKIIKNIDATFNQNLLTNPAPLQMMIKEYIRGKEIDIDKAYIQNNINDMVAYSFDFSKSKNAVKKVYNGLKKDFDSDIKEINKYKNDAVAFNNLTKYLSYLKWGKNVAIAAGTATVSCMWEKVFKDMTIVLRLHVAAKQKEEKEAKAESKPANESAVIEPTSFQTELASLFNF